MNHIKTVKIILAAMLILSLFGIFDLIYVLVRFISLIGFLFLAYQAFKKDNKNETFIYIALALLFQSIFDFILFRVYHINIYYFYRFFLDSEPLDFTLSHNIQRVISYSVRVIVSIGLIVSIYKSRTE